MLVNTRKTYGLIAQLLHWTMAGLILFLIPLGIFMHQLPTATAEDAARTFWFFSLHKTLGVAALFIAVVRVAWACLQPHPLPLNSDRKFECLLAQTIHWTLYGAIIVMPLSGWLHHAATEGFAPIWWPLGQDLPFIPKSTQLADMFALVHFCTAVLLGTSIALHIAGALKHAVIDRDDTLRRMIPGASHGQLDEPAEPQFKRSPAVLAVLCFAALGASVVVLHSRPQTGPAPQASTPPPATMPASGWRVDMAKSRLGIKITQSGSPITGTFRQWRANINLDPADLQAARIDVTIDIASLSLGGVTDEAISPDFLNAKVYPTARFRSADIAKVGEMAYEASGELTLAGKTRAMKLPFKLTIKDGRATAMAQVTLDRLAYGVGQKSFPRGTVVGLEVMVDIAVEADRTAP